MPGNSELTAQEFADRWSWPVALFVVALGFVLRVTNLDLLPPFLDETSGLLAIRDYQVHPVMDRIFLGKYAGYLLQRPVIELANDPLWAGRALSGLFGTMSALLTAMAVRRLAGDRAGLVAAVVFALAPQLVFHDRLALPESIAVFFVAASCWTWVRGCQQRSNRLKTLTGALVAWGCATKIYMAPAFLLLPILSTAADLGEWRAKLKTELPFLLAGFTAGAALLLVSALDPTWEKTLSLSEVLRMPKMIGGDSLNGPPLTSRLVTAGGLLTGYLPVGGLLVIASAALAPKAFRSRVLGCLAVAAVTFLLYAIVFRSFAATRYFNVLWVPIAFGVGLAAARTATAATAPLQAWWDRARLALVALAAFQFTARDLALLTKPETFKMPASESYQYFTGWPSGRGLAEVAGYFRARTLAAEKPVLAVTLMGFRHGNASLPLLLRANDRVRFVPAWDGNSYVVDQLPSWLTGNLVFALVEPMGTPVDLKRLQDAGYQATLVFTAPDFTDVPGYKVFQLTRN